MHTPLADNFIFCTIVLIKSSFLLYPQYDFNFYTSAFRKFCFWPVMCLRDIKLWQQVFQNNWSLLCSRYNSRFTIYIWNYKLIIYSCLASSSKIVIAVLYFLLGDELIFNSSSPCCFMGKHRIPYCVKLFATVMCL